MEEWLQTMIKTVSLTENKQFLRLYKKGKYYVGKFIVLYVSQNKMNINRIGITVSKKIGKSVKRNKVRRLIRENYRLYEGYIKSGFDCVFVARESDRLPDFWEIRKEMKFLLRKLEIFDQEKWECLKNS